MNPRERFDTNLACPARGRVDEGNIGIDSQKEKRYKCKVCDTTDLTDFPCSKSASTG